MNNQRNGKSGEHASRRNSYLLSAALGGAIALAGFSGHAFAQDAVGDASKVPSCVDPIKTCGCAITKAGLYHVTAALNSTQGLTSAGNCLEVRASNVTLDLNNNNISGPGAATAVGAGIYVKGGAANVNVVGGPGFSIITGWAAGIDSDSNNGTYSNIYANQNSVGFEFLHSTYNNVTDWAAYDNTNVGLWIRQGRKNFVTEGVASNSKGTTPQKIGILLGCGAGAVAAGVNCSGKSAPSSTQNAIVDNDADDNGQYGIALDTNATKNLINGVVGSGNVTADLYDGNAGCDSNNWVNNSATNAVPACTLGD